MADDPTYFCLELSGDDISPENVRMSTLFGVLGGLERAIEAMAGEMGVQLDENEAIIIPGELAEASLVIPGLLNRKAKEALRSIDHAFYADEVGNLPATVRSELRGIQSTLERRSVRLEMSSTGLGLHGVALTADSPHIEEHSEENDRMISHAVVYGVCMRVNRSRKDAAIELHDGQNCTLKGLTDQQLKKLMQETGDDFDQVFRIEGQATWSLDDYRIGEIDVASIESVERNAGELFGALRKATGNSFDGVDPIGYVNELRGK